MSHSVVLVNEKNEPLGRAEKLQAHADGWLHRAFSIFIFNPTGRLLLQQRVEDKYHSGGLWSNSCCSHPSPGEAPLDAARRRLTQELGFTASLTPVFQETYQLPVGSHLVEHEYNQVYVGTVDTPNVRPNPQEVADWTWVRPNALRNDVAARPHRYTTWFRFLLDPLLATATASDPSNSSSPAPPTTRTAHSGK